ncbi:MAG: sulfatase-like hydrolase/transferase [Planctomycetota bacterium]
MPDRDENLPAADARALIRTVKVWYHAIEVAPGVVTPALDLLAARGLRYARAFSSSSWTSPSTASLFTGRDPPSHGGLAENQDVLMDGLVTLAEQAQALGLTTAAIVANDLISREKNFDQGFETFVLAAYANARQLNELFFDWLHDNKE